MFALSSVRCGPCLLVLPLLLSGAPALAQQGNPGTPAPAPAASRDFAFLGVNTEPRTPGDPKSGLRVIYLFPTGAAETMGVKVGDEIIALNDIIIKTRDQFIEELRNERVGATIRFLMRRGGDKVKIKGKIGSYKKTTARLQEMQRKSMYGKPLPALPPVQRWDPKSKSFRPEPRPLATIRGQTAVVFAFDDCPHCQKERYAKMLVMANQFQQKKLPISFLGVYQGERQHLAKKGDALTKATALFGKYPPPFPVVAIDHEKAESAPAKREANLYLYRLGMAIVDPQSTLRYLQVGDVPGRDFALAFEKVLRSQAAPPAGQAPPASTQPPPPPQKPGS